MGEKSKTVSTCRLRRTVYTENLQESTKSPGLTREFRHRAQELCINA